MKPTTPDSGVDLLDQPITNISSDAAMPSREGRGDNSLELEPAAPEFGGRNVDPCPNTAL